MAKEHVLRSQGDIKQTFRFACERLVAFIADQPDQVVLGLCGGRSVVGILEALRDLKGQEVSIALEKVHFFMVDERLVPLTDEYSNFGGLQRLLFADLLERELIKSSQLHPFNPKPDQPDHGTSEYMRELHRFGGKFDAIVLGMGEDGHVAGLFPNHPVLQRTERQFFSFYDSPKLPPARMTASVPLLTDARLAFLLATGEGKRAAYARYNDDKTPFEECPSRLVKGCAEVIIVTDL